MKLCMKYLALSLMVSCFSVVFAASIPPAASVAVQSSENSILNDVNQELLKIMAFGFIEGSIYPILDQSHLGNFASLQTLKNAIPPAAISTLVTTCAARLGDFWPKLTTKDLLTKAELAKFILIFLISIILKDLIYWTLRSPDLRPYVDAHRGQIVRYEPLVVNAAHNILVTSILLYKRYDLHLETARNKFIQSQLLDK